MSIHSKYLRYRFWIQDFFNGSPIGKPYKDIKNLDRLSYLDGRSKRESKLKQLLIFAQANTTFYKKNKKL